MELHKQAVDQVSRRVKAFDKAGTSYRMYHGSTNSTRRISLDPKKVVDTSALNHVIQVDTEKNVALVEPNVPMDSLVEATLKYGLVPPVVPEFPGITVGGSYSGTAGESSSFKHGFFDRTINWVEFVLADGTITKASPRERSDLFYGAVGACGTLGVTTLFELQLQPTGRYVEVTYLPVYSPGEATMLLETCARDDHFDFLDGILFARKSGVIIVGRITDKCRYITQRFSRRGDPWFYLHAQEKVANIRTAPPGASATTSSTSSMPISNDTTEIVPLQDYLFRYDRGAFWMGSYTFSMFWLPTSRYTRYLLDQWLHTRPMYTAMHHSGHAERFIIQDLIMPSNTAEQTIEWVDDHLGIYPLWLCPIKGSSKALMHNPTPRTIADIENGEPTSKQTSNDLFINIGVWGSGPGYDDTAAAYDRFVADNRAIEQKVKLLGGFKWIYAHMYYTEEEFWEGYDKKAYDELRKKYGAEKLPTVFEKIKRPDERMKRTSETRGALKMLLGFNHLFTAKK
ncbi:MAG: hypothetical protein M1828_000320 [Chrysothrix sp. TS-e1954]|nr:MAG: hypothetical protein M1828_000320 [Chrysothrix sp. TS-e1954]